MPSEDNSFTNPLQVDVVADDCNSGKCTLLLHGYLRAHCLSVNQLVINSAFFLALWVDLYRYDSFSSNQVHISGAGDFQLGKIEILKDPFPLNARKESDAMESDEIHDLEVLAVSYIY